MLPFGTYRLVYEPPRNTVEAGMEMSISGEATLEQMLDLFGAFLRANGYAVGFGDILTIGGEIEQTLPVVSEPPVQPSATPEPQGSIRERVPNPYEFPVDFGLLPNHSHTVTLEGDLPFPEGIDMSSVPPLP